jgi:hypothetical protein
MYRYTAVISQRLVALVPLGVSPTGVASGALWFAAGLFAGQYVLAAVSARHSGIRFVTNVLAVHSAKKVTTPNATTA